MSEKLYKQNRDLTALMNSYQEFFAESYQKHLMASIHNMDMQGDPHEMIQAAVETELDTWYSRKLKEIIPELQASELIPDTEVSVSDWLADLTEHEMLISLALHAAIICDDAMPRRILIRLHEAGQDMRDKLRGICLETDWTWQDDQGEEFDEQKNRNQQVCCSLMKVLGQWQSEETTALILDKFAGLNRPDDRIAESVGLYLINMGPAAVSPIIEKIEALLSQDPDRQIIHEYLMMSLAAIGQTHKQDEIFTVLRKSFRKMQSPLLAAACIGDYGDPRGIRVLRSYLEDKLPAVAPALFQEMASAIKKLGGNMDGLVHPMFPMAERGMMS